VVKPDESQMKSWAVPDEKGPYNFVCTFPGHGYVMYGTIYILDRQSDLPLDTMNAVVSEDVRVPVKKPNNLSADVAMHPYPLQYPLVSRTFLAGASPAAIAVGFENQTSYCWDAGRCMLRYAWEGGFVDNGPHWEGNGKHMAEIEGKIFYESQVKYPLLIGDTLHTPQVQFKGYKLIDGIPVFLYIVDGNAVTECIKTIPDGKGYFREFTVDQNSSLVFFMKSPADHMTYSSDKGRWHGNSLVLTAEESKHFMVKMSPRHVHVH
jgi:hypothetical protein